MRFESITQSIDPRSSPVSSSSPPPFPPPPSPPPSSPHILSLSSSTCSNGSTTSTGNSIAGTIYVEGRRLAVQGYRIDLERSVYQMSHHSFTLDRLYYVGGKRSLWWRLVDCFRMSYPGWFLPNNFIMKVFESDVNRKNMTPEQRASNEIRAYENSMVPMPRWKI